MNKQPLSAEELLKALKEAESDSEGRSELQSLTWNTTGDL